MAIIEVGEDLIDEETGEYAGPANITLPDALETYEDLVAYMHRLNNAESRLQASRMQYDSVLEHCRKLVAKEEARVEWMKRRYEADARAIAYAQLPRKKDGSFASKTVTMPWGTIAFRDVKPTVRIVNDTTALAWAEANMPEAVKVKKSVLVSPVKEYFLENQFELPDGFELVEGYQSVSFTTIKYRPTDED